MRRRVDPVASLVSPPAELVTFKSGDWAGFAAWWSARWQWRESNGWPTNSIHFMREMVDVMRALPGKD